MNVDTGQIYHGFVEIDAARERGERILELAPSVWDALTTGYEEMDTPREVIVVQDEATRQSELFRALGAKIVNRAADEEARRDVEAQRLAARIRNGVVLDRR